MIKGKLRVFLDDTSNSSPFYKNTMASKGRLVLCILFHRAEFLIFSYGSWPFKSFKEVFSFVKEKSHWKFLCILAKTFLKPAAAAKRFHACFLNFFPWIKPLFCQKLFEHPCFSSMSEIWEALPQLHFLLKSISILKVLLFWPWVDFELNALVAAHISNDVQVCPSTEFIPYESFQMNSRLWEQPLTASSHLPLQSDFPTPRKKHKQLIKVYTEMLDEEINNLSDCPKWQVQNKQGHGDTA